MYLKNILVILLLAGINIMAFDINNNVSGLENNSVSNQADNSDEKAANFKLKSTDGKFVQLSDFKGKIVIIDFWATWCGPCRKGIPDLVSIQNDYKNDVVVLGISLDGDKTKKNIVPFIKQYGINYPILYGTEEVVKNYGDIQAIPTSFIIDRKGNIVDKHVGLVEKTVYINKIKELSGK